MVSEAGELDHAGQRFAQERVACVADVEGVVGVGLGVLDHHPLAARRAAAEVLGLLLGQRHHTTGECRCVEVGVEVGLLRSQAAESRGWAKALGHLPGQGFGADGDRDAPPGAGFGGRRLEADGRPHAPLAGKRDRRPIESIGRERP